MGGTVYLLEQGYLLGQLSTGLYPLRSKTITSVGHHQIPIVEELVDLQVNAESMQIALLKYFATLPEIELASSLVVAHVERTETIVYAAQLAAVSLGVVMRYPNQDNRRFNFDYDAMTQLLCSHPNVRANEYHQGHYVPWVVQQVRSFYGLGEQ